MIAICIKWGYKYHMETPRRFSSDTTKQASNMEKHGVDFATVEAFEFDIALDVVDDRKDYGEVRQVALSFIGSRLHVLVFTMRGDTCHVISLRKANKKEIRTYVENT